MSIRIPTQAEYLSMRAAYFALLADPKSVQRVTTDHEEVAYTYGNIGRLEAAMTAYEFANGYAYARTYASQVRRS